MVPFAMTRTISMLLLVLAFSAKQAAATGDCKKDFPALVPLFDGPTPAIHKLAFSRDTMDQAVEQLEKSVDHRWQRIGPVRFSVMAGAGDLGGQQFSSPPKFLKGRTISIVVPGSHLENVYAVTAKVEDVGRAPASLTPEIYKEEKVPYYLLKITKPDGTSGYIPLSGSRALFVYSENDPVPLKAEALRQHPPSTQEFAQYLQDEMFLIHSSEKGRYVQQDDNCMRIATKGAQLFGFKPANHQAIIQHKASTTDYATVPGEDEVLRLVDKPIPQRGAFLVVRQQWDNRRWDWNPAQHVSFAYDGNDYNYGVDRSDSFYITQVVPLMDETKK